MTIGLLLIYLLLSLVCTTITEFIAAIFKLRAKDLQRGIYNLFGREELALQLYNHPLIRALYIKGEKLAYIPSRTFALALLDTIVPASIGNPTRLEDVRLQVGGLFDSDLRRTLLLLTGGVENSLEQALENIENWFNSAMDRVSGAYKERTQWILLALGLSLPVG